MSASFPSPFFVSWLPRLREAARDGWVADLACGRGRHALAASVQGLRVIGLDRNAFFLGELRREARRRGLPIAPLRCDLEAGGALPLRPGSCAAVLVFRYLHRPLAPAIVRLLQPGGLLLYETFSVRQPELGWGPKRPEFLVAPGELPGLFAELEILETWEGIAPGSRPEAVARLAARRRAG